jgi:hypothetical protein
VKNRRRKSRSVAEYYKNRTAYSKTNAMSTRGLQFKIETKKKKNERKEAERSFDQQSQLKQKIEEPGTASTAEEKMENRGMSIE